MDKFVARLSTVLCLFCLIGMPAPAVAENIVSREYKVKAAYLYNLIKFINWPPTPGNTLPATPAALATRICVYGENPFSNHLDRLTNRQAKGKAIEILYVDEGDTLPRCDILFLAGGNQATFDMQGKLFNLPILTVGESTAFLDAGGIIGLILEQNNIQLQINLSQAKKNGFEISGNLLEIAKQIQ